MALRRRGVGVLYLGSDVPVDSWTSVLASSADAIAVVAIVTPDDRGPARDVVAAIEARGRTTIALGGPSAEGTVAPSDRVLMLPDRVVDAAAVVAGMVRRVNHGSPSTPPAPGQAGPRLDITVIDRSLAHHAWRGGRIDRNRASLTTLTRQIIGEPDTWRRRGGRPTHAPARGSSQAL